MLGASYQRRKRPVTACQPCYQKKQRCDRQVPCSNCARRQQPNLCHYATVTNKQPPGEAESSNAFEKWQQCRPPGDPEYPPFQPISVPRQVTIDDKPQLQPMERLLDRFGFSLFNEVETNGIPTNLVPLLQDCFKAYPKRSITDALVQSFFEDMKWVSQDIDEALFEKTYKDWWNQAPTEGLERVLFGILLLRVCCIGLSFLQLRTPMSTEISTIGVSKVATHCDKLANKIQDLVQGLPGTKSYIYVEIIYMNAVYHGIQGDLETAWYTLSSAIRILQYISVSVDSQVAQRKEELSSEIQARRSMFLNVLIMDSILCFFLDRPPTVSEERFIELQSARVVHQILPSSEGKPGPHEERLHQAKLWQLWTAMNEDAATSFKSKPSPSQIERRYHRLRTSFIDQLPETFSLNHSHTDKHWNLRDTMLNSQRAWLHANVLIIQCGILQDCLLFGHTEIAGMSQDERSMTHQHVKLLADSTSTLRKVLCNIYNLSGSKKGAISILRPFATRSAILAGLSFIYIRSMYGGSRSSRSWPDCQSEDNSSLEACRSHIKDTLTLLTALQCVPAVESERRCLQDILGKIDNLSASDVNANITRDDLIQQRVYEPSLTGGTIRSSDFPLASADLLGGMTTFNAPPSMNDFQGIHNNETWNNKYFSMLLDATSSGKPTQGVTMALNLDDPTPFNIPMFDTNTSNSTPSTSDQHWENNIGPISHDVTSEGLLNDDVNIFV